MKFLLGLVLLVGASCSGSITLDVPPQATPPPARPLPLVEQARQDAVAVGIDPSIFVRQIEEESGFNASAHSPAGAIGVAQIMPDTARGWGVNPSDPVASLKAAAHAMARYLNSYGRYDLALAAYNAGTGVVNACLQTVSWFWCLPQETRNYITIILGKE